MTSPGAASAQVSGVPPADRKASAPPPRDPGMRRSRTEPDGQAGLLAPAHPVDLADFERWQMVDMNGVEQGLMVQNLMIATQALGKLLRGGKNSERRSRRRPSALGAGWKALRVLVE